MTGFSPGWLSLREPCDHRARNAEIRDAVVAAFTGRRHISVVDLACGTGSNLRALAPYLPERQTWHLVDSDPILLSAAHEELITFADNVKSIDPLSLHKSGRLIKVCFGRLDLRTELAEALDGGVDLVTAAAFFDLVSPDWIGAFCEELSVRNLPLYTVLNYSGEETWRPPHAADAAMLSAFHGHQTTDKGFGPAVGPAATSKLQQTLKDHGYNVCVGPSPWRLNKKDAPLISVLVDGVTKAVSETGLVPQTVFANWRSARMSATECEIGHIDLFAFPYGRR
ncbi:MAG: class I SAM-dependent methyltransferase [Rhodomicrobium sp.]